MCIRDSLNAETGKITFNRPLNYRELSPGQEYSVTIPVFLLSLIHI